MKNIRLLLSFSLLLSFFSSVSAQSGLENQLLNLSKRKFRWMVEGKLDSLSSLLDDRLSYIHSNGSVQSKQQFLDDFTVGKLVYNSIQVSEMNVRLYKKSAVVTGKGQINTTRDGNTSVTNLMFTEVYVDEKSGWKMVSRHASRLPQ